MPHPDVMNPAFRLPDRMTMTDAFVMGVHVAVELDGKPCADVVEFDQAQGWIRRYARDDRDRLIPDGAAWRVERLEGVVTARISGWW